MRVAEVAGLLGWRRDAVKEASSRGVELPRSRETVVLVGNLVGGVLTFDEEAVDDFIARFEAEEPGRHPPVWVRRALLVETGHRCGVCFDRAPPQFHHIIEFRELQHHDPAHMLAACGTCHSKMTNGSIDRRAQRLYKDQLTDGNRSSSRTVLPSSVPLDFDWQEMRELIEALHLASGPQLDGAESARFDFTALSLDEKNRINELGEEYFVMMTDHHEPYFGRIDDFLRDPANAQCREVYYDLVDTIRTRSTLSRDDFRSFEEVIAAVRDTALAESGPLLRGRLPLFSALLSFMYVNCDIGRKT